jgi:pimeloyl-ACP methyl ester carboxylesterase
VSYKEHLIECPDGRTLEAATLGQPSGHTIFFHHGTPGSTSMVQDFEPFLEHGNFFFVTTSRPGYGSSSRLEGRDVASVVNDVTTVLDFFHRDKYAALGWSGGGPHALACAALDTPRCLGAVTLASVVPLDVDFDWTEGMGPENLEEFALAKKGGPPYEEYIATVGGFMGEATEGNIIELFGGLLPDVDKEVLADDRAREVLASAVRHGFLNGWRGFYDDNVAFFSPWGFDPTTIAVPVAVWYGDADLMVPPTHGAWLASHLPSATAHHQPNDGHLSLYARHVEELASNLADLFA